MGAAHARARLARALLRAAARFPRLPVAAERDLPELRVHLGVLELQRGALGQPRAADPLVPVRRDRDRAGARVQLPARVLDRLPGRPLEERLPRPRRGAVLRHLPDPDDRLADDPLGRRHRRQRAADDRPARGRRPPARDLDRRRRGDHLQLPPVRDPADLRLARAGRPAARRGGVGSLREPAACVPAGDAAALAAGHLRGDAADVHPRRRRLHQRRAARRPQPGHDRERDPVEVPRPDRLPVGGGAVLRADGADRRSRSPSTPASSARSGCESPARPVPRRLRGARDRLHAAADRRRPALLLQPAGRPLQLRLAELHVRQLDQLGRRAGAARRVRDVAPDRGAREPGGDDARDADRARARAARLPRPGADQLPHLPADGRAGDRARRLAADAVPEPVAARPRLLDDLHRPRDVQHLVRRRHRARAPRRLRPPSRGGRRRPRRDRA